jgi:CHAT domain-containing protein/Tfp pilus assembly protein PilF
MYWFIKCVGCLLLLVWPSCAQTPTAPQDLLAKGKQLYSQEGPKAALPKFEEALRLFRSDNDRRDEAITLGYLANCHRKLGNLDQAVDLAQQALRMKEELGDRGEAGNTHNQLGLIFWERADYPAAIQHLQQAIEIASSVGDKELEGAARNNLGLVFDERGEYNHSLEQYQHALELHRVTHFERGEGDTLGNIGGVYLSLGKFREALAYYQQALQISERLELKPASSDDLGNIALCLAGLGDIDGALTNFDHALKVAHETNLAKEEADWRKGKGTTLAALGRYDAALHEYAAAEQVYQRAGLQRELVEAFNDTGTVYELLGDGVEAEMRFQRALRLARKIGHQAGESTSLLALGDLERRRKRNDVADTYFTKALQRARAAGDGATTVAALDQRARNDLERKRYNAALRAAMEAKQFAEKSGNRPSMAEAWYVVGEARRVRNELPQSLEGYAAADALGKELRDPELGWRILYGRGQAFEAQGKQEDAVTAYQDAIGIIEKTRADILEERYRAGYIEDRYQVYVSLVELLLKLHQPDTAFFFSEKLRTRAYFDQLGSDATVTGDVAAQHHIQELARQIHSLRHALQKEYSAPEREQRGQAIELYSAELSRAEREYEQALDDSRKSTGPKAFLQAVPTTAEIQHWLRPDTALIEYVVGKHGVSILCVTGKSVAGISSPISTDNLTSRTELLRDLITQRKPEWVEPARALYSSLWAPLESAGHLRGIRKVLIVPDGTLNYIPFSALPNRRRQFLGDQFEVAYLPAAVSLVNQLQEGTGKNLLALAPDAAHLKNTSAEVRSIGNVFQHTSRVVIGKAATETLFKQIAGNFDYLHLATHGSLNGNAPSLSALDLEPDTENDGRLELYEVASLKLHARLVTLSACETALGRGYFTETPAGGEFVGMTRAFLNAGGRNVLASLWAVNDESTRALMIRFYRHLSDDGPAYALAQAQRELRQSDARYRDPFYWAAFEVAGPIN